MAPPSDFAPFEVLLSAPDKNAVGTSLDAVASGSLLLEGPRAEMAAAWGLTEAQVQRVRGVAMPSGDEEGLDG